MIENVKRRRGPGAPRTAVQRPLEMIAAAALCLALVSASASDDTARHKQARLLMVTHSAGFQHEVVRRDQPHRLSIAEQAVADLAQRSGEFAVRHLYTRDERDVRGGACLLRGTGPSVGGVGR
jgi:hypothetical protein